MPDYCPACSAIQELREDIVSAKGYVRPLSEFDRRHKRRAKALSATRIEKTEHVGKIVCYYSCSKCGTVVIPGETHVRNWTSPDHWLPITSGQRRGVAFDANGNPEGDGALRWAAWRKENRDKHNAAKRSRCAKNRDKESAARAERRRRQKERLKTQDEHHEQRNTGGDAAT